MILDGHIHIRSPAAANSSLSRRLHLAGIGGGIIISLPPSSFPAVAPSASPQTRMKHLVRWCQTAENLYPFYWIDPLEADAEDQVAMAVEKGAMGFKVICDRYYPGDERALAVFTAIAKAGKPILFHSGILWDGKPSSRFNRPAEFEPLMGITGLKFSLAHISWPWCDELIAVYGKFLNAPAGHSSSGVEMFIDITPGTPPIYRREALTKLFTIGYDVKNNVIFGTDSCTHKYNDHWARQWIERDSDIYRELGLDKQTIEAVYVGNVKRFVGLSSSTTRRKAPKPGV